MNIKRILTTVIGLPIVMLIFIFGNKYIIDCLAALIAIVALSEYFKCVNKDVKPISWVRIFNGPWYSTYSYNKLENFININNNRYSSYIVGFVFTYNNN